ncbi:MAG: type III-A CRISPR-associated protein Cas10/Csm1 [Chloroflexota bacterium]
MGKPQRPGSFTAANPGARINLDCIRRRYLIDERLATLVIAAGCHDLGKVWLRTGQDDLRKRSRQYCVAPRPHTDFSSCRECRQEFGYLHALLGLIIAQDYMPEPWRGGVSALVATHHRAGHLERHARILVLADRLSAAERATDEEAAGENRQLRSLLTEVSPDGHGVGGRTRFFALKPLAPDLETLTPQEKPSAAEAEYSRLWDGLSRSLEALGQAFAGDAEAYLAGLFTVLQLYLWAVPSAYYRDAADISLFEHLRTTAALAAAIFNSDSADADLDRALEGDYSGLQFDLVAGDLSGVQAFLYTLTSRAVARGLRGRSFYLDMITELSARWLLKRLGLPVCNLLYAGGGRFYILSYPVPDYRFGDLCRELEQAFLAKFEGQLYLALARVRLTGTDIDDPARYAQKWVGELGAALGRAKDRRFAAAGARLFLPQGGGPPEQVCAVCGREGADKPLVDDSERRQCGICADLAELGRDLAEANGLILHPTGPENPPDSLWPFLGYRLEIVESFGQASFEPGCIVQSFNPDPHKLPELFKLFASRDARPLVGWRFRPQVVPRLGPDAPEHIADFETLAGRSEGAGLLGILRMDVDNLGRVFSRGLGDRATPARYSTLSFLLRLYFEAGVDLICRQLDREPGSLYLLYSGGDDLFIVGSWDLIPKLALRIRQDFARFTGNGALTLSAGIYLADHHRPLYQTAEAARRALEAAKARRQHGRPVKDGVAFMDRVFGWPELEALAADAERLRGLVAGENGPGRVLLHRLMGLYLLQQADRARLRRSQASERPHYGPWVWRTIYYLGRLAELYNREELRRLAWEVHDNPGRLEVMAYAARWAELLTRKKEA